MIKSNEKLLVRSENAKTHSEVFTVKKTSLENDQILVVSKAWLRKLILVW